MENMLSHVFFCFVGNPGRYRSCLFCVRCLEYRRLNTTVGEKEECTQYADRCVSYLLKYIGIFTAFWYV